MVIRSICCHRYVGGNDMGAYSITEACVGCTICAKNCPVHAIMGNTKERHMVDPEKCIRCGVCGKVCAYGAVLTDFGKSTVKVPKTQWEKPTVNRETCAGCSVCIANCPKQCLELTQPGFHGDIRTIAMLARPMECIGCGICDKVCPIGAIMMVKPGQGAAFPCISRKKGEVGKMFFARIWCRVFQAVMKVANYFLGYRMPETLEGPGSISRLPEFMKEKGASKALVVTDGNLLKLGLLDGMLESLTEGGFSYSVFSDLAINPTSANVEAGYKVYKDNECQCLVAFGGGAPMDCAKGIAAKSVHPNKSVKQLQGILKVHKKIPLFFAIPTTAGTGSETTVAAVITDSETHHKASINDPSILPGYAILDPELTVGLPPMVTATTGMDALSHAVEAYTNHTYNTPLEDKLAKDAVQLIFHNLLMAYRDGNNLEARQNMQRASFFAGRAFTRGCVGYVHAVGHTLGGLYGVAHGLAMSIILPHVMRQYGPAVHDRLADLADVCGMEGETKADKANQFILWIEKMKKDMDIPVGVDMIREEDVDQIITWAMKEGNPLYPVPVIWGREDFRQLLNTLKCKSTPI